MANPMDIMQRALTVRLGMQMSLSQLPIVEESMDIDFSRWLDHVPMPPEMPAGTTATFNVTIASDLSRVYWDAYGAPRGFIPKLSKYFDRCAATADDIAILNQLGGAMEPSLVGSWIGVEHGALVTGWQFREHRPFSELEPHLGQGPATAKLIGWCNLSKIATLRRFKQAIRVPTSDIELALPGDTPSAQVTVARTGFEQLFGYELPDYVEDAATAANQADVSFAVRVANDVVSTASLIMPFAGNDVVSSVCSQAGIEFDDSHAGIQQSLQSAGAERVVFRLADGALEVDLITVPGSAEEPAVRRN